MSYVMLDMYILVYTHAGVHLGGGGGGYGGHSPPLAIILAPLGKLDHLEDFTSS